MKTKANQCYFDDQLDTVYACDREAWRQWLSQHHRTSSGIWLIYYKVKSGKPSVRYSEAVKEALCFGWIDSKVKSLDGDRYKQIFTPRKPKSVWSRLNKQYIEELRQEGLMSEVGFQKINAAKQDGSWTALDDIEALLIPMDLQFALESNKIANQNFQEFNNSTQKNILSWIASAKRSGTRLKRIEQTISSAVQNRSPLA
jgi:uncharacterized protein YdeI (YjbR/CyaY-like superfamily)